MNWLNLETNELRAPEFLAATALERGVWLSLLLHCVAVENGGRMVGAAGWSDRQWMVVCGLERGELLEVASALWKIEGDDVLVWGYPHSVQRGLEARRENGKKGGRPAKSRAENPDGNQEETETETERKPGDNLTGTIKKGKGKKDKEKEGNVLPGAGAPAEKEMGLALEVEQTMPVDLRWTRETGWQGVTADLIGELGAAFPACHIRRQFLQMEQWLIANPAKARKAAWRRFVTNWLKREQDKGGDLRASRLPLGAEKKEGGGAAEGGQGASLPPEGWEEAMEGLYGPAWEESAPSWPAMTPQDQARVRAWVAKKKGGRGA